MRLNFALALALVIASVANSVHIMERDDARADLNLMTGMYNGVLIGRGCEVPE